LKHKKKTALWLRSLDSKLDQWLSGFK